jgi:hypothetical protein
VDIAAQAPLPPPAQPGQAIKLGRKMDPELVPDASAVKAQQEGKPEAIASRATVPPSATGDKSTTRS